ncbi:hypothetical protein ARMGADRAFT_529758 [Armillaria gallica]|uniref:Uncharacterized protein n=1 Tax=Armillaria gallica TaxID=47427 RepID=A0A2H3CU30_ARMGA|nr:hypothetical protein ARMGADRAFT_529758 [Armillaria gallica]
MKDLPLAVPAETAVVVTALWSCPSHSIDNPWRSNTRKRDFKQHTSQPFMDTQGAPTPSSKNYGLATKDLPLSLLRHWSLLQFCRRAPHIPTKTPDIATLLSQIQAGCVDVAR